MDEECCFQDVLIGPTGRGFKIWNINGLYWPRFPDFPELPKPPYMFKNVEARDDDIFICSFPRSGLHWTWEITRRLTTGKLDPSDKIMEHYMLEFQDSLEAITNIESPRVFPTHLRFNEVPQSFIKKRCKFVYVQRDPRAVAVSYYRLFSGFSEESGMAFDGSWDDFLPMFLNNQIPFNGWFEMQKYWEDLIQQNPHYPVHVIQFENLLEDPVAEIQRLALFLNVDSSPDFCSRVASCTQFDQLKAGKELVSSGTFVADWFNDKKYQIFRKGRTDEWKNQFTIVQHDQFLAAFQNQMKTSSYKLKM